MSLKEAWFQRHFLPALSCLAGLSRVFTSSAVMHLSIFEEKLLNENKVKAAGGKGKYISPHGFKNHNSFLLESEVTNAEFGGFGAHMINT